MALDVVSNILLSVKADTKDAKRKLRDLSGAERKAAKEFIEGQERRNAKLDRQIELLGKATLAVGAVAAAYAGLSAAAERYSEITRLQFAAQGADINRLEQASRGLISTTDTLKIAAALQNGAFEITNEQMETAIKAMVSLRNQGNDFVKVQEKVTQALVEGNVEALKEFGVQAKGASDTLSGFTGVMAELTNEADKTAASIELVGDTADQQRIRVKNLWDDVVSGAGQAALAIGTFAANVVEGFDIIAETIAATFSGVEEGDADALRLIRARRAARGQARRAEQAIAEGTRSPLTQVEAMRRAAEAMQKNTDEQRKSREARKQERKRPIVASVLTVEQQMRVDTLLAARASLPQAEGIAGPISGEKVGGLSAIGEAARGSGLDALKGTKLATVELTESLVTLQDVSLESFGAFQGAAMNAFQAFIEGSASAKEIARRFVGDLLSGLATQMFSRSLFHAAEALALLIPGPTFNPAGAAVAGKTAAAYAAGAVVVGGLARAWGTGAPSGAGGRAAGGLPAAAAAAQGTSGPGSTSQTFIVNSNPFDDNPREARRRLSRAFDRAREERGGTGTAVIRG